MNNRDKKKSELSMIIVFTLIFISLSLFLACRYWLSLGKKLRINFIAKDDGVVSTQDQNINFAIPAQIIKNATIRFAMNVKSNEIESITAKLKFKTGPREIKLGIRGSENDQFVYQPFYQKLLQDCNWDRVEEIGNFLYEKSKKYGNLGDLVNNPPHPDKIASYYINPSVLIRKLSSSGLDQRNRKPIDIKTGLRGTHTFVVRVDKAPFYFKISKQDLNMYEGEDKYLVSISHDGQIIEEKSIADDGFVGTESLKKDPQSVEFNLTDVEPGVYEVDAEYEGKGEDSIITEIETNQSKLVVKNQVFTLSDNPTVLYTKQFLITLQTYHSFSIQTIKLNDAIPLEIKKNVEKYVFDLGELVKNKKTNEFYKLETSKSDVIFSGFGYFAFAPKQYFDPEVIPTTDLNTIASLDEIDYILTSVPKARQEGEWWVSEVTFNPKDIKLDGSNKLYFSLEVPDLENTGGELEIGSFEVQVNTLGILSGKLNKTTTLIQKINPFFAETYQKSKMWLRL